MPALTDMGKPELERRLLAFDRAVAFLYPNERFRLVLVGSSALILLGTLQRGTTDIDALVAPAALQELMASYDINSRVTAYQDCFSDYIEDRLVRLDIETKSVEIYSASLEDLIASKLCSSRDTDELDIRKSEVTQVLDWHVLDAIIKDMENSVFSPRSYKTLLFNYENYKKEFQQCAR